MRSMRRCSPRALAAPVITAVLALCPLTSALQAPSAHAATITTNPIQVTLSRLTPIAPQPGDTLVVAGELRNTSTTPIPEISYELKMGSSQIGYRSTFDTYAEDQDGDLDTVTERVSPVIPAARSTLSPGQSERYQISIPVSSLGLDPNTPQVREIGISVTSNFTVVGHLRTFLPWDPRSSTSRGVPVGVAWIWPLVDSPHRTTASGWFNDSLAPELDSTGRLGGLLSAGSAAENQRSTAKHPKNPKTSVPVTWALDPMLVNDVQKMTAPYNVTTSTGTTLGKGTPAAKTWLAGLRNALASPQASVLPLPYGDPDVVAAARAGFSTAIGLASAGGRTILQQVLGTSLRLLSTVAWPPGGLADQRSINELLASGDNTLVLSDTALPPVVAPPRTPSAPVTLTVGGQPVNTLLTDSGLSTAVDQGVNNPDGSRVSLQRYLAETLMIHAEAPSDPRNVIVAPNRRWAPSPAYASALLADTGKVPWIKPVSLSEVQTTTPTDTPIARKSLAYPESARHNELSGSYLKRVRAIDNQIDNFSAILPPANPATRAFTMASWQALSSAWRSQHGLANTFLDSLGSQVATQIHQVRITSISGSFVTLTSHGGKVPVTIANDLSVPVTVRVDLLANQRLTLSQGGRRTIALPPHQQTVVEVHASAKTSGVFPVTVQLLTPKGNHAYGRPVNLFVRSTVYGTITLVITGAATAALMVAVAIRLTRRALAARRANAAPA